MVMTMKKILLLIIPLSLLLLVSCARFPPEYLVKLHPYGPGNESCTGFMVKPDVVVTAGHCVRMQRVVTYGGQEATVDERVESDFTDLAAYRLKSPLVLSFWPKLGEPNEEEPARFFGLCPRQWGGNARWGYFQGSMRWPYENSGPYLQEWLMAEGYRSSNMVCGGDSGGIIMQGDKVVGVIVATYIEYFGQLASDEVIAVPVEYVEDLIDKLEDTE